MTLKGHRVIYHLKGECLPFVMIPNLWKSSDGFAKCSHFSVAWSLIDAKTVKFSKLSRFVKNGPNELKIGMLSFLKDAHEHAKCHQNRRGGGKKLSGLAWNDTIT